MGLAFGAGLVWAVRIIAGGALGKEAMGFGDVTLMGMIGAWLGWQPALLVFAIAPFAALFIAVAQLLMTRHTEIAFGPYLSLGAVVVVACWGSLWHDWAKWGVFAFGPMLLVITLVCLVLMAGMLGGWRAIKERWIGGEQ
jgi:prepilin signal peptidase PulO-like enzyme (type II secretory pathway)